MIIIKDSNEESKSEMRHYMRNRMRSGKTYHGGYRTSTSYKEEENWKDGYEQGWKDCEEEMESEDYRRSRR